MERVRRPIPALAIPRPRPSPSCWMAVRWWYLKEDVIRDVTDHIRVSDLIRHTILSHIRRESTPLPLNITATSTSMTIGIEPGTATHGEEGSTLLDPSFLVRWVCTRLFSSYFDGTSRVHPRLDVSFSTGGRPPVVLIVRRHKTWTTHL
jgi:hypothetical protein